MSEYTLGKIKNEDYLISEIRKSTKLIITTTELGKCLEFGKNDSNISYRIPIRNIESIDILEQEVGKIKKTKDKVIQVAFNDVKKQRITIWLNPEDRYIDDIQKEIVLK
jgi:hypothetical protein